MGDRGHFPQRSWLGRVTEHPRPLFRTILRARRDSRNLLRGPVLCRVAAVRAVLLLAGPRALMLGALNPLNFIGSTRDARGRREPLHRLQDTGLSFEMAFFDALEEIIAMLADVARRHRRVHGVLLEDAGPYPAGTRWAADAPEQMLWTIAVLMDSLEFLYSLFVRELSADEQEEMWTNGCRRVAIMFGTPEWVLPGTYAAFRSWFDSELASDRLYLIYEALYFGRAMGLELPMPRLLRPFYNLLLIGSLPPRVREEYRLPWDPWDQWWFDRTVALVRWLIRVLPRWLTVGRNDYFYELLARRERERRDSGRVTPHLPPLTPEPDRQTPGESQVALA